MDEPVATITATAGSGNYMLFEAEVTSNITGTTGISYRWDFGDGSPFVSSGDSDETGHHYEVCGVYTVRVEATDSWGNVAIGSTQIEVTEGCQYRLYLPFISNPVVNTP
jgi:PKD repeat protein